MALIFTFFWSWKLCNIVTKMSRFLKCKACCLHKCDWGEKIAQKSTAIMVGNMWLKCNHKWAIKKNNGRMEQMWGGCGETQSRHKTMKLYSSTFSHNTVGVFNWDIFPRMHFTCECSGVDLL